MVEVIGSSPTAPTNRKKHAKSRAFSIGGGFDASTRRNRNLISIAKLNAPPSVNLQSKFLPWGSRLRETAKPCRPAISNLKQGTSVLFSIGGGFDASTRRNRILMPIGKSNAPSSVNLQSKFLPWDSRLRETAKPCRPTISNLKQGTSVLFLLVGTLTRVRGATET